MTKTDHEGIGRLLIVTRRPDFPLIVALITCLATLPMLAAKLPANLPAPVQVFEDATSFTLANGILTARIARDSGSLVSLRRGGLELLTAGGGYWSTSGSGSRSSERGVATIRQNPARNGGARAEVSCRFPAGAGLPADVDYRYSLARGETALACYAVFSHRAGQRAFGFGEARFVVKLNPAVFDFMTIDAQRRQVMPTGGDWDRGTPLNIKEARRLTTGVHAGRAEHKYDYSAVLSEIPAYGWSGTKHGVGLWLINPSIEYLGGGPTKVELTGHLDVNPGGLPVLLNMWVGSHYGGCSMSVAEDENWSKVVGPFLLYANSAAPGTNLHLNLWRDALLEAGDAAREWPFPWLNEPDYPPAIQRATVTGRLNIRDPLAPGLAPSNIWVGLTAPDYLARGRRAAAVVDWQRDAKFYQFWTRADAQGRFTMRNVRAGNYTLNAFADGVIGEGAVSNITLRAAEKRELGELTWQPRRFGKTIFEIGVPDRTAREFRHGDNFWHWGLYYEYPKDFPSNVNFTVGVSDPRRDWNYAQPATIEGRRDADTTWTIRFNVPAADAGRGRAALRLGIAGSRLVDGIRVRVNGTPAGNTGPLPDTGVMHRDGIRGYWCERVVMFDGALLRAGANTIELSINGSSWVNGVLYDCVRLELAGE
jgi:rhamnogalacturonan endolyase